MDKFDLPSSLSASSTLSSSSSLASSVSAMDSSTGSDELSEITELPRLETEYEAVELGKEVVLMDSMDAWGIYQAPWFQSMEDCDGYVNDQLKVPEIGIADSFNSLLWNY